MKLFDKDTYSANYRSEKHRREGAVVLKERRWELHAFAVQVASAASEDDLQGTAGSET